MRHVHDGLHRPFERHVLDLVQHDRQHNGNRKTHDDAEQAEEQRIADNLHRARVAEQCFKMQESYPRAVPEAIVEIVVLEGDDQPAYRGISENQVKQDHRQKHQDQRNVHFESSDSLLPNSFSYFALGRLKSGRSCGKLPFHMPPPLSAAVYIAVL